MMRRIVSIWLNRWETDCFFRKRRKSAAEAATPFPPFALVESGAGGERLAAICAEAEAYGLAVGGLLTDARALVPALETAPRAFAAAQRDLTALARWCERYAPFVAPDPPDGIFLDIAGCAHLFGGEEPMLADMAQRLRSLGVSARIACADTPGAAHAGARYGPASCAIIPSGGERAALAGLDVAALRLAPGVCDLLRRLGLKRIGRLYDLPRAPLAARFGEGLLARLDQAVGRAEEAISPLSPAAHYGVRMMFPEPVARLDDIEQAGARLAAALCLRLQRDGRGAKEFTLRLFGVDGTQRRIAVSSSRLLQHKDHIVRLFHERIIAIEAEHEEGFGVDAASLEAGRVEPARARQDDLAPERAPDGERLSFLLDRIAARLGPQAIIRLGARESHIPERAQTREGRHSGAAFCSAPRPLLLLPQPERVDVLAEIPDGPPAQFTWRRVRRRVASADGPERIGPEWWDPGEGRTRDYFRVEDSEHHRYWLYRDGLYGAKTGAPIWYVHGLFI